MYDDIIEQIKPIHAGIRSMQDSYAELKEWREIKDTRDAANQKALDNLILRAAAVPISDGNENSFLSQFKNVLREHHSSIKNVRKGFSHAFEMKADMTIAGSVTGSVMRSYLEPSALPSQIFNFRDLVQVINTDTGLITIPRETTPTGSASRVPTENTAKPQIEGRFTMIDNKADYISGYARISKQMLQDLSFLQTWLPRILLREFYKAENAQFYADLIAVATGSTATGATVYAEKLIDWMANLGAANYMPNAMVGTFAEWAALLKTTSGAGATYSVPGGVTIDPSGAIRIAGVPFRPANWIGSGKTIIGDWSQAVLAVADPVKVEFFEQDQDNVIKNMITVRVEAREVLVIEQPGAFIFA